MPNLPGVPPLSSYAENAVELLFADAAEILLGFLDEPQWGVFLNGVPVIVADNQVSFDYKQDWPISTYPVEEGQFQTYDRVQLPSEIRVRFSAGGAAANRQQFLQSIDQVMNSGTTLYDVLTPEEAYLDYTFQHRDFARTADSGVGLITVDLWMLEVVETATAQYQNTQQPGDAGQQGSGQTTATSVSSAVSQQYFNAGGAR